MRKILAATLILMTSYLNAQYWQWGKSGGNTNSESARSTATDLFGNVYVVGYFRSNTINFGSVSLNKTGEYNAFILKIDGNGSVLWGRSMQGGYYISAESVTTDPIGNAYVTGVYSDSVIFGGDKLERANGGSGGLFLAKFDPNGNELWIRGADTAVQSQPRAVVADPWGGIYLAGEFKAVRIAFGGILLANSNSSWSAYLGDMFLTKYDTNGTVQWAKQIGSADDDEVATSLSIDRSGNLFVGGQFESDSITVGSTVLKNTYNGGSPDAFVAKYDTSGNIQWARSFGGQLYEYVSGVAADALGNCYVAGSFNSAFFSFGSTTLNNVFPWQSYYDLFIAKYDSAGNELWAKATGGVLHDEVGGIATDVFNNVYLSGEFESDTLYFGNYLLSNNRFGYSDLFAVKFDNAGNTIWAKKTEGKGEEWSSAIAVDEVGNAYVVGGFRCDTLIFNTDILYSYGCDSADILVAKIGDLPTGVKENMQEVYLEVFPNPATTELFIQTQNFKPSTISIYDMNGRRLSEERFISTIDISALSPGVYFLELKGEGTLVRKRWVKVN